MQLREILKNIDYTLISGSIDQEIHDLKCDSRDIQENDIFVALPGFYVDGHDFIPEALNKKASVIVLSKMVEIHENITVIKVNDTRVALAYMASALYNEPSKKLTIIGVTGTTGKTTTTHMIYEMLKQSGYKCGMIGSIGIKYNDKEYHTDNTTPESLEIHKYFQEMVSHNVTHVVMETSSQAFKMHRLDGITFDIGVLTNITTDHISPTEHASQEEYVACKHELFTHSKKVIINNDALYLPEILKDVTCPVLTYAIDNVADINATNIKLVNDAHFLGLEFSSFGLINANFKVDIPGLFNVYNALATILVGYILGIDVKFIQGSLDKVYVPGRMQSALITPKFKVIIDYAHTIDAMKNLVGTLKEYNPQRLISIFGGGGDRAKERRYALGSIIGASSDLCILTMDNPRFEEISSINEDIKVGLNKVNAKYIEITDRKDAIRYACLNAWEGDVIVLIGKGHEEYQDIKGTKYHFSELEILEEIKQELNNF